MGLTLLSVVAVLAAWNPPATAAALGPASRGRAMGLAVAAACGVALAALGEPILDLLGVSAPTFRTAAGVVVAVSGAVHVAGRTAAPVEGDGAFGGVVVGLFPGPVFAAVAAGVDAPWWLAGVAVAIAAYGSWWFAGDDRVDDATSAWLVRLIGAVAVLAGVLMTVSGVKNV